MKLKRIVHIIPTLRKGGAERLVVDLCNELANNSEIEIYLVSLCDNKIEDSFIGEISKQVKYLSFGKGPKRSPLVALKIARFLNRIRPNVVHTHLSAIEYTLLPSMIWSKDIRFFHTIHSVADKECSNKWMKGIRRFFYAKSLIHPVTISGNGRDSYREYYNLQNDILIRNGRPALTFTEEYNQLDSKNSNKDNYLFVAVGRLDKGKNHILLVEALKKFNSISSKKANLIIVGDYRDKQIYQEIVNSIGKNSGFELVGPKSNVGDYLKLADAFCLTSTFEGMPISLIEALSLGVIPICTPVGGIPEMIIDNVTGFLSKDLSIESYFNAIQRFHEFSDKINMSVAAKENFNMHYHITVCAQNHLKSYSI